MKIDMHLHCSERSGCSISTELEQIESAIAHGLNAVVITDHNKLVSEEHLKELNEKYYPFKIFGGVEIRTEPHGDDVLVIGVKHKSLQEEKWTYGKLYKFVKERGGFIALCHPYRYGDTVNIDIDSYKPDAVEIHSTNIGNCDKEKIQKLAEKLGSKLIANSDGHFYKYIGIYYNVIEGSPNTEEELAKALLAGDITIGCDEARIEEFNLKVREREIIIKKMLEEGKTGEEYCRLTGEWIGNYNRVAMGKSYEI